MDEKELFSDYYLVGANDDRCFEDIKNNIYPCDNKSGYISYCYDKENE